MARLSASPGMMDNREMPDWEGSYGKMKRRQP
jgi:hypothetical protein